jgi:hypothetical protein
MDMKKITSVLITTFLFFVSFITSAFPESKSNDANIFKRLLRKKTVSSTPRENLDSRNIKVQNFGKIDDLETTKNGKFDNLETTQVKLDNLEKQTQTDTDSSTARVKLENLEQQKTK